MPDGMDRAGRTTQLGPHERDVLLTYHWLRAGSTTGGGLILLAGAGACFG